MQQRRRRSGITIGLLSLGLLAGVALTASPAQAASGNGPYYAEPAWDRKMLANRFLILTNWASEAVLDKETGLVWERSPDAARLSWNDARFACTARTTGNRKGWRLPSVHELASLVDPANSNPALPTGHPILNVLSDAYWSVTTDAADPSFVWFVNFFNSDVNLSSLTHPLHAWCVRGGMNADQY
jgi:hypothetical protein